MILNEVLRSSSPNQLKSPRIRKYIRLFLLFSMKQIKIPLSLSFILVFFYVFLHTSSLSSRLLAFNSVCTGRIRKDVDSVVLLTLLLSPCAFVWVWVCDVRRHTSFVLKFGPWISGHFGFLSHFLCGWAQPMPLIIIIIDISIWSFDWNWIICFHVEKSSNMSVRDWGEWLPALVSGLFTFTDIRQCHAIEVVAWKRLPIRESGKC